MSKREELAVKIYIVVCAVYLAWGINYLLN